MVLQSREPKPALVLLQEYDTVVGNMTLNVLNCPALQSVEGRGHFFDTDWSLLGSASFADAIKT